MTTKQSVICCVFCMHVWLSTKGKFSGFIFWTCFLMFFFVCDGRNTSIRRKTRLQSNRLLSASVITAVLNKQTLSKMAKANPAITRAFGCQEIWHLITHIGCHVIKKTPASDLEFSVQLNFRCIKENAHLSAKYLFSITKQYNCTNIKALKCLT